MKAPHVNDVLFYTVGNRVYGSGRPECKSKVIEKAPPIKYTVVAVVSNALDLWC